MTKSASATKDDIDNILSAIKTLDEKTTAQTSSLGDRIDALDEKTTTQISSLGNSIDALGEKTTAQTSSLGDRIDAMDRKTTIQISSLGNRIDALDEKTTSRIDDVLEVLDVMMTRIDERFVKLEDGQAGMQAQTHNILNRLDSIEKQLEISEDERLVMAHQLTRLHEWVERAAERINVKFVR